MTLIKGSADNYLLSAMKLAGIQQDDDRVYVVPQIMSLTPSAPPLKGRRKHTVLKMELGFDPTVFDDPKSIDAFLGDGSGLILISTFNPRYLSNETLEMVEQSKNAPQNILGKYPELLALWEEFLPKWKDAYKRALAQQDKEEENNE